MIGAERGGGARAQEAGPRGEDLRRLELEAPPSRGGDGGRQEGRGPSGGAGTRDGEAGPRERACDWD